MEQTWCLPASGAADVAIDEPRQSSAELRVPLMSGRGRLPINKILPGLMACDPAHHQEAAKFGGHGYSSVPCYLILAATELNYCCSGLLGITS